MAMILDRHLDLDQVLLTTPNPRDDALVVQIDIHPIRPVILGHHRAGRNNPKLAPRFDAQAIEVLTDPDIILRHFAFFPLDRAYNRRARVLGLASRQKAENKKWNDQWA